MQLGFDFGLRVTILLTSRRKGSNSRAVVRRWRLQASGNEAAGSSSVRVDFLIFRWEAIVSDHQEEGNRT
ncbi:hypothetical protein L1887_35579 [Cichorium endivia]|nr:hypothetical protein L1887_35579 [Cichorium endivia]